MGIFYKKKLATRPNWCDPMGILPPKKLATRSYNRHQRVCGFQFDRSCHVALVMARKKAMCLFSENVHVFWFFGKFVNFWNLIVSAYSFWNFAKEIGCEPTWCASLRATTKCNMVGSWHPQSKLSLGIYRSNSIELMFDWSQPNLMHYFIEKNVFSHIGNGGVLKNLYNILQKQNFPRTSMDKTSLDI